MHKEKIGFAIIGTGAIAHMHAKAIQAIDHAELLGVYNRTPEKALEFASKYGCRAYETLEGLLEEPDVKVVCICTASGAHLEPALRCLEADKHCLIEKPIEISTVRSQALLAKARERGLSVGVIFPSRFHPPSVALRRALDQGRFGDLVLGSAYVKWSRDEAYYASAPWRGTWGFDGGGALMNQAIHSLDLLQWYMGPVEQVHGIAGNRRHKTIEVEDTLVANFVFGNGALGSIECTTAAYPGSFKRLEIIGTKGTAVLEENTLLRWEFEEAYEEDEAIRDRFSGKAASGGVADPMDIGYFGHQQQIEDFIAALAQQGVPLVDGEEGEKSLRLVEAIYESVRTEKTIYLNKTKKL